MAKFCGKCGSALVDDKCPACDIVKESTEATTTSAPVEQATPVTTAVPVTPATDNNFTKLDKKIEKLKKKEEKKAAKKAKKKAKWQALSKKQKTTRIILKVVAWLLVAIVLTTVTLSTLVYFDVVKIPFINSILVKLGIKKDLCTAQNPIVFSYNDHTYYTQSYHILNISDDENIVNLGIKLSVNSAAFVDNTIYCRQLDDFDLYKLTINDDGSIDEDIWVDKDTIKATGLNVDDMPRTTAITNLTYLDDYFYFYYFSSNEFYINERDKAYRLGRISLDGEKIELLNENIHTNTIATDGEWLYYFENGYQNTERHTTEEPNSNIIGIYRTKSDCKKNELIYKMEPTETYGNSYSYRCSNLKVYNNYLYFLNGEDDFTAKLCRINLKNNKVETIIKDDVVNYTIDTKNNKVYYLKGEFLTQDPHTVCEFDIDSKDKRELFKTKNNSINNRTSDLLTIHNGYLYICDPNSNIVYGKDKENPYAAGYRYNIEDKELYALCAYDTSQEVFNSENCNFEFIPGDRIIYWKKIKVTSDSIYSYQDIIK